jgi:hypothetical protein
MLSQGTGVNDFFSSPFILSSSLPERFSFRIQKIGLATSGDKKKAMMLGSPWPNKKAMGFSAHGL